MWEGRFNEEWKRWAELLCVLYNAHRDSKKTPSPFKATDFHPILSAVARANRRASGAGWGKLMTAMGSFADQCEFEG